MDLEARKLTLARTTPFSFAEITSLVASLRGLGYLLEPRMSESDALDLIEKYGPSPCWSVAEFLRYQR